MSMRFWDRVAGVYDLVIGLFFRKTNKAMLTWCLERASPGASVLELAAGTGAISAVLAPEAARYVATDYSDDMLKVMKGKLAGLDIEFCRHDLLEAWPEEGQFDMVVAANVLHLLDQPELALQHIRRALRPGGVVLAPTYCHGESKLSRRLSRWAKRLGFPVRRPMTAADLVHLFEEQGFTVKDCRVVPNWVPLALVEAV